MPRGLCPICREPFDDDARFRDHLSDAHGLFDDPGTESRLPGAEDEVAAEPDEGADSTAATDSAVRGRRRRAGRPTEPAPEDPEAAAEEPEAAAEVPEAAAEVPEAAAATHEVPEEAVVPLELATTFEQLSFWPVRRRIAREPGADPVGPRLALPGVSLPRVRLPDVAALRARLTPEMIRRARLGAVIAAGVVGVALGAPALSRALDGSEADVSPAAEVAEDTAPTTAPAQAPPPVAAPAGQYVVGPGDTLAAIADRAGVPLEALVAANGIANPNLIYRGQVLTIPQP